MIEANAGFEDEENCGELQRIKLNGINGIKCRLQVPDRTQNRGGA